MSIRRRFQQRLKRAFRPAVLFHRTFYLALFFYYFAGFANFVFRPVSVLLSHHYLFLICTCILVGTLISWFCRLDHWSAACDLATGLSVFCNESFSEMFQFLPSDSALRFFIVMAVPTILATFAIRAKRWDMA